MKKVVNIANSEGPHLAIAEFGGRLFLMIKQKENNDYSYFPIDFKQLKLFLDGKITVKGLLPSFESFIHIDKHYEEISQSAWIEPKEKIMSVLKGPYEGR
jgi:hypothetical protein